MARKYMSNPRAAVKILAVIRKWFSGKLLIEFHLMSYSTVVSMGNLNDDYPIPHPCALPHPLPRCISPRGGRGVG